MRLTLKAPILITFAGFGCDGALCGAPQAAHAIPAHTAINVSNRFTRSHFPDGCHGQLDQHAWSAAVRAVGALHGPSRVATGDGLRVVAQLLTASREVFAPVCRDPVPLRTRMRGTPVESPGFSVGCLSLTRRGQGSQAPPQRFARHELGDRQGDELPSVDPVFACHMLTAQPSTRM